MAAKGRVSGTARADFGDGPSSVLSVNDVAATERDQPLRIAVLASGNGSNLQAIIDSIERDELTGVSLVAVLSDKANCRALQRAAAAAIATEVFELGIYSAPRATAAAREVRDRNMVERLRADHIDLVVLAGYMQILSPEFVAAYAGRIVNVHPSLLPDFPGLDAIAQALDAGVAQTGVTVHYVDEGVDTGPVIAQESVAIKAGDTTGSLAERIHAVEHRLLPSVIAEIAASRITRA